MLVALPKTLWLRFNAIFGKQAKGVSTAYMEIQSIQQQMMKPYEAYSQARRNMY